MQLFQVDAFADKLFTGNPAAVIPLHSWIEADLMQKIAMENNLAETVFFVPAEENAGYDYEIRWFTPAIEVNLCGHATLAAGFVLFNHLGFNKEKVVFKSASGLLTVFNLNGKLEMDFPSWPPERTHFDAEILTQALGGSEIIGIYKNRDIIAELNSEDDVKKCQPDFGIIKKLGIMLIITAPGKEVDFVSRFFAPFAGIDEDPVTGRAHSHLIPFWSEKLRKKEMTARQLSARGGTLSCRQNGDRVIMGGNCVFYMEGRIDI